MSRSFTIGNLRFLASTAATLGPAGHLGGPRKSNVSRWLGICVTTVGLSLASPAEPMQGAFADEPATTAQSDSDAEEVTQKKTTTPKENKGYDDERFDKQVREDIFAGLGGDEDALKRGIEKCNEVLKKNPKHAEALVWRGAAKMFKSGQLFSKGNTKSGMKFWMESIDEMNRAKKLEPDNVAVMIPRAAVMINAGRSAPAIMGRPLLESVRDDFEKTYAAQKKIFNQLGEHPQGELRMGLADVYRLLNQPEKSKAQLEAVIKELPDSDYAERAAEWLQAKPQAKLAHQCIGCHGG